MVAGTEPRRQQYERDGYLFPIEAMPASAADQYRNVFESIEAARTDDATGSRMLRAAPNLVCPFVYEIMCLPSILESVQMVLGGDLIVTGANFFIKEPATPAFVSWHQDLTYWGYDAASEVTAWVALTPATTRSGCMRFIPGSHRHQIVEHRDTFDEANMLSRGQEVAVDVDEAEAVDAELLPGEMSLHHGRLFHASGPNDSADRRIGLAIRYVTPSMQQLSGRKTCAQLVSGQDRFGHFELVGPPSGVLTAGDLENANRAMTVQEQIGYEGAARSGKRII